MICPQCRVFYEDDFIFCLTDGNALINAGVEQETLQSQKVGFYPSGINICSACGKNNPANSKFCNKCGAVFTQADSTNPAFPNRVSDLPAAHIVHPLSNQTHFQSDGSYGETIGFVPPNFVPAAPPVLGVQSANKNVLIVTLGVVSIAVLAGILIMANSGAFRNNAERPTRSNGENSDSPNSVLGTNTDTEGNKSTTRNNSTRVTNINAFQDPLKEVSSLPERFSREYRGYSNRPLTMSLRKDGSSLSGTATTPGDWDDLQGTINPDGSFVLAGNNRGMGITGHWRGRIDSNGSLRGIWTATNGRRVSYSASLVR